MCLTVGTVRELTALLGCGPVSRSKYGLVLRWRLRATCLTVNTARPFQHAPHNL